MCKKSISSHLFRAVSLTMLFEVGSEEFFGLSLNFWNYKLIDYLTSFQTNLGSKLEDGSLLIFLSLRRVI